LRASLMDVCCSGMLSPRGSLTTLYNILYNSCNPVVFGPGVPAGSAFETLDQMGPLPVRFLANRGTDPLSW
jgi:hypothetical protein